MFNYLGVTLDETMTWKEHVAMLSEKVNKRLGMLGRIRNCLTLKAAQCVYNTIINPIFNYADTAWGELSQTNGDSLQRLQNRAASIIMRRNRSREAIDILGWMNLSVQRKVNKCVLVYKSLNGVIPQYFEHYFCKNNQYHNYNTRRNQDIHLPNARLSVGKRTFRFSAAVIFNSLTSNIKNSATLSIFKTRLKNHFYST